MFRSVLIAGTAFAILAAAAVAHGFRTDRWGVSADLEEAARRLQTLPLTLGDWEGEVSSLDDRQAQMTQATGILVRRYANRRDHTQGSIMVLCGRSGPIGVHPPEACYGGAGYVPGPASIHKLPNGGTLWVGDFTKAGPIPETLRIYWGWSDGGDWLASESPRFDFFHSKVLYKLYVIQPVVPGEDGTIPTDTRLLDLVVQELRKCQLTAP
jgi:hypothetical protein